MNKQPKGLYLLIFAELWESFSFFGMRTLLVLFMIQQLKFTEAESIGIYALFTALVSLGGLRGGYCADRILGLRSAIFLGGGLIAMGHICLALQESSTMLFLGLSFIVVGTSLFVANVTAFVGLLYRENDPRKETGYTLFYAGINLGGFSAALLCGYIVQEYGWKYGFGLAAMGMLFGLAVLFKNRRLLQDKASAPERVSILSQIFCLSSTILLVPICMIILPMHEEVQFVFLAAVLTLAFGLIYRLRKHEAFKKILSSSNSFARDLEALLTIKLGSLLRGKRLNILFYTFNFGLNQESRPYNAGNKNIEFIKAFQLV